MLMTDLPIRCPTSAGHFGAYGGVFVAETLIRALDELKGAVTRGIGRPGVSRRSRVS